MSMMLLSSASLRIGRFSNYYQVVKLHGNGIPIVMRILKPIHGVKTPYSREKAHPMRPEQTRRLMGGGHIDRGEIIMYDYKKNQGGMK